MSNISVNQGQLHNLKSVINLEKESCFEYLSKYISYISMEQLAIKFPLDELLKKEKIYHDMILNPNQYKVTRMRAWTEYIGFILKIFGRADLRYFLVLENFTKSSCQDKENFNKEEFATFWLNYAELCEDALEVLKFMKKYQICTRLSFYYYGTAVLYEKEHDFHSANAVFLEGMEKNLVDLETLQSQYTLFENRMEGRINREVKDSIFSSEEINDYIQGEAKKSTEYSIGLKRSSQNLDSISNLFEGANFCIKKKKIEYSSFDVDNQNRKKTQQGLNSIRYGEIPVYVDESFRKNVITKGSRFSEIYSYLVKFLLDKKDKNFLISHEEFKKKLEKEKKMRPSSWIKGVRILPEKILMPLNDSSANIIIPDKKVEEVMNNMLQDLQKKSTPLAGNKMESELKDFTEEIENRIKNRKLDQSAITGTTVSGSTLQVNSIHPSDANEFLEDGKKYRIVKVETNKKETVMSLDMSKMLDPITNLYQPLSKMRVDFYLKEKERKAKEKDKDKNRRKTIVFKVDSDGDLCMSSEEKVQPKDEYSNKRNVKDLTSVNNLNNIQQHVPQSLHINSNSNFTDYLSLHEDVTKQGRNFIKVVNKNLNSNNKPCVDKNTLNLFESPMTCEQINDKIKQAEEKYDKGEIDKKTFDILVEHLYQKFLQFQLREEEKKNKDNLNKPAQSFTQIISVKEQKANPFLKKNQIQTGQQEHNFGNNIQVGQIQSKDMQHYLEIKKELKEDNTISLNNIPKGNNNNFNLGQPHHNKVLTKPEDTFNNVSRSLDFTNINLLENPQVKPASLIFDNLNTNNPRVQFQKEKKIMPSDEVNISFDSEHSFLFQNKSNSLIKDEDFIENITPSHDNSFHLHRAFNIKDTPQLLKKHHQIIKENEKANELNKNLNYMEKETNESDFINDNKIKKVKFTDLKNVFEKDDDCEKEKKKKLSNLFGDTLAYIKEGNKDGLNINNQNSFPFGLSSINERNNDNTYLSEDSFFLKKII
jgi:hypothetical protein